ncbi:MAG: flagellar hook-associated protein FlgK [Tissierellia bacterium]|nr:flagellar hook-associated protein FlgK [Tissierellia bacterium]
MSFGGLYISISGIYANKKSLDTLSHNIANANNKNYVRQSAIHGESRYTTNVQARFQKGTGVDVQQIRQIRDEFLDLRIRNENALYGYYSTKSEMLGEIEAIFNEMTTSGLQNVMDDFWNAWEELYKEPDSLTIRGLLHETAVAFTTTINHINTQLNNLQFDLNKEMINRAEEINGLLEDIVQLNKIIRKADGYGSNMSPNDFLDDLNGKLDRLSELIPIKYYHNQHGDVVVTLNGRDLINEDYYNPLKIEIDYKNHGQVHWSDTGELIDLAGQGELGGHIDARDKILPEYRDRLNILVGTLASVINAIHRNGHTLEDVPATGLDFFKFDIKNPSASIKVNPELGDFDKIATSLTGARGDGEIARAILSLRNVDLLDKFDAYLDASGVRYVHEDIENWIGSLTTIDNVDEDIIDSLKALGLSLTTDEYYKELILDLSLEREEAIQMANNQDILIRQLDQRRQEISAVSLDEEMANMIKYQHSYVANSRVVNAIDEMLEKIINGIGVTR